MESLHALFAPGALLRDSDHDGIADGVAARFTVSGGLPVWAGAMDLAARLGLEATGLTLPLVGGTGERLVRMGPGLAPAETGLIVLASGGELLVTGPDDEAVRQALQYLAARYPYLGAIGGAVVPEEAMGLQIGAQGVSACLLGDGWVPAAEPDTVEPLKGEASDSLSDLTELTDLYKGIDTIQIDPDLGEEELASLVDLAARIGVERSRLSFPVALLPGEQRGGSTLRAALGEGSIRLDEGGVLVGGLRAIRYLAGGDLAGLRRRVEAPPAPPQEVLETELSYQDEGEVERFRQLWRERVRPALEPGRSISVDLRLSEPAAVRQALREELLAELPPGSTVQVRSCFKQGFHWIEEEVLPSLRRVEGVSRIELAFRRFVPRVPAGDPVLDMEIRWLQECYPADLLLARELGLETEAITFTMAEEGPTYRLTAYDSLGQPIWQGALEAVSGSRRYLDRFPERGWVHPPTGGLWVDGSYVARIETDVERLWRWYQGSVLPALRSSVVRRHGESPALEAQPLFGTLHFEAWLSEDDRRLELREEMISPLDALHEDLYFVTLDYMATWGRVLHGSPFGAPGTILPFIHQCVGQAPHAAVRLTWRPPAAAPARPVITGLTVDEDGEPASVLLADGRTIELGETPPTPLEQVVPDQAVTLDRVIGPDQLPAQLAYLRSLPGVRVWQAGASYMGRPCYAIELRLPVPEAIQPPAKASAMKPVLLINARHHANEVSSTNAVLRLVERAAKGDAELAGYLRGVNIVINPLENMDGAATHYAMMQEHPTWKLHSARFNAVGLEFYGEYVNPETPYGEARVLQELFASYGPDVLLDDHGVPSHEWLQPFAGYSSAPYFRVAYWLPNALLYGIFRDLDPGQYPEHVTGTEALRTILTRRVRENQEVYDWNQAWLKTYQKWGVSWVPEKFPEEIHDGMICYTWPAWADTFSVRFPETCLIDWVTEVPDETAQGEQLRLTIAAHLEGDLASMEFLAAHPQPVERRARVTAGGVCWTVGRTRPFRMRQG